MRLVRELSCGLRHDGGAAAPRRAPSSWTPPASFDVSTGGQRAQQGGRELDGAVSRRRKEHESAAQVVVPPPPRYEPPQLGGSPQNYQVDDDDEDGSHDRARSRSRSRSRSPSRNSMTTEELRAESFLRKFDSPVGNVPMDDLEVFISNSEGQLLRLRWSSMSCPRVRIDLCVRLCAQTCALT